MGVRLGVLVKVGGRNGVQEGWGVALTVGEALAVGVKVSVAVKIFGVAVGPKTREGRMSGVCVTVAVTVLVTIGVGVGGSGVNVQASQPMQ